MEQPQLKRKITQTIECTVCLESVDDIFFSSCCKQDLCKSCSSRNAEIFLENTKCISCGKRQDLSSLSELFEKLNLDKKLKLESSYHCWNCKKDYTRPNWGNIKGFITCENCQELLCPFCNEKHNIEKECFEIIPENMKKCFGCNKYVEKILGCDHITCPHCNSSFCWKCNENWDPIHPLNPCKMNMKPEKFTDGLHWATHYIERSKSFVFQTGQWKFFINGLTSLANIITEFQVNPKLIKKDRLLNIFGIRLRQFPLKIPTYQITSEIISESVISFVHMYLKQCSIYYIVYLYVNQKIPITKMNQVINDMIKKDVLRSFLHANFRDKFLRFILDSNISFFKTTDLENWLIENLFTILETSEYLSYVKEYLTNFDLEKQYFLKQSKNNNISIVSPFSK